MEEEKKELEAEKVEEAPKEEANEAAPVEEAPVEERPVDAEEDLKKALTAFILSVVAFVLIETGLGAIICGAIALGMLKKISGDVQKKPHAVFMKIAKPVAIVSLILGILVLVGLVIWGIVVGIMAIVAAIAAYAEGGAAAIALLF